MKISRPRTVGPGQLADSWWRRREGAREGGGRCVWSESSNNANSTNNNDYLLQAILPRRAANYCFISVLTAELKRTREETRSAPPSNLGQMCRVRRERRVLSVFATESHYAD